MIKNPEPVKKTPKQLTKNPEPVKRLLRKEVGFGCPVPGCGNPYLYYHHFDPPWKDLQHNNPDGMIALCGIHHPEADNGAFTKQQLREFKVTGAKRNQNVRGRFNWMRNRILAVIGGNFFYETYNIVEYMGESVIWLNRDEEGYLLLNISMITLSTEPRVIIRDNDWIKLGNTEDLKCPPSGKLLEVKYGNGDEIKIEFIEFKSKEDFIKHYPEAEVHLRLIEFPITVIEVTEKIGGSEIHFGPKKTVMPGYNIFQNFFVNRACKGFVIGLPP